MESKTNDNLVPGLSILVDRLYKEHSKLPDDDEIARRWEKLLYIQEGNDCVEKQSGEIKI